MKNRRGYFWIGLGCVLLGGVLLTFWPGKGGTVVGTTLGLAGAGLVIWALAGGPGRSD